MPFLDHLEELRWRILKSLVAVLLASMVGWVIVEYVDVIGLLMRPIIPLLPDGKLRFTSPTEPFLITLKFAFVLGLLIASPVVIYQTWAFLAPALYDREKRLIVPALSVGVLLFLTGAAIAYQWRSEEHTSELQSRLHLVCRLLLEKKKRIHATVCVPVS